MKATKKNQKPAVSATEAKIASPLFSLKRIQLMLGILVFLVFANSIGNGYNMDDELVTREHKLTSQGLNVVGKIFTSPYYQDDMGYAYGYRPVVHLSFAIEHQFFGESPAISHFFNVLFYVLSVVLFFRLLLKWTGEKGLSVVLIAAVLFAVHPVHSEVVASIKNRDEILAFLFVILSGLSIEKFLVKNRPVDLFWLLLFFTAALLSKKSVFPMAILLPVIAIFIHKVEIRKLLLISGLLLVPAVVIGSEMNMVRMVYMSLLIMASISVALYIQQLLTKEIESKKMWMDYRFISFISAAMTAFALYEENLLYVYASLIILIPVYSQNKRIISFIFLLETMVSCWFFQDLEMTNFGLFISLYFIVENFFEKKNDWFVIGLALCFAALFLFPEFGIYKLYWIASYTFFLIFLRKKSFVAISYALVIGVISIFIQYKFQIHVALILFVALLQILKITWKRMNLMYLILIGGVIITIVFDFSRERISFEPKTEVAHVIQPQKKIEQQDSITSFVKEGRNLEMIENTLILPHTKSETIGTGVATLGEYMRLMVFPAELSFYYGYARTKTVSLHNPWVWVSIFVHLSLIFLALWQLKKRPLLSIGIAWYLLSILLFSNWVELVAGMVGERLAFTASAGFCIFIASVIVWIKPDFSFKKTGITEIAVGIVVLLMVGRTVVRNADWRDPVTLMGHDAKHLKNSAQVNNLYALHLMQYSLSGLVETPEHQLQMQQRAIYHFDKALKIWPEFFNAAYDKGRAALVAQDTNAAIAGYEKAVSIGNRNFLDPYYQLGELYLKTKREKDYLRIAKKIFEISNDPDGYNVLARAYFLNGYRDSSVMILEKAILEFPQNIDLKKNLEIVTQTPNP